MRRIVLAVTVLFLVQPHARGLARQERAGQAVQTEIYIMNIDGTGVRNLTNHPSDDQEPEFSPDGARLVFDSERNGNADIFVMNIDGSNLVQLTDSPAKEGRPASRGHHASTSGRPGRQTAVAWPSERAPAARQP